MNSKLDFLLNYPKVDVESEGETGEGTSFEYFEPADVKYPKVDVESKAETGEGMSLEYFETVDVKYSYKMQEIVQEK